MMYKDAAQRIMREAQESCGLYHIDAVGRITTAIEAAVAAEKEACAKIADRYAYSDLAAQRIAAEIRDRK